MLQAERDFQTQRGQYVTWYLLEENPTCKVRWQTIWRQETELGDGRARKRTRRGRKRKHSSTHLTFYIYLPRSSLDVKWGWFNEVITPQSSNITQNYVCLFCFGVILSRKVVFYFPPPVILCPSKCLIKYEDANSHQLILYKWIQLS